MQITNVPTTIYHQLESSSLAGGSAMNSILTESVMFFFFWGFASAFISAAFLQYIETKENKQNIITQFYGLFLSGCVGGLLAVAFDRSILVAIIVGLTHQFIYTGIIKSAKSGKLIEAFKEILLTYLGGKK